MQLKKGDQLHDILIETMAAEGKCIAHHNGQVVFVSGCAPGDTVDLELTKIKSGFLEGKTVKIKNFSPARVQPFCSHFGQCGGCSWQHINYETQLKYKQQQVIDNLERIGGLTLPEIYPIIGSARQTHYRNKLDFTFTSHRWLTKEELQSKISSSHEVSTPLDRPGGEVGLGYHIPRMYDRVFDVSECFLQPEPSNSIRLLARKIAIDNNIPFFDLRKQTGFLRTLTIRTTSAGETMVILQVTYEKMEWIEKILNGLASQFPQLTSINYIINGKRNDTFHDLNIVCWRGNPFITETMKKPIGTGELQFRIGPKSFYQTNSAQAFELYKTAFRFASLSENELVFDLYTGTGTIANFVAGHAKKVIGLEYVPDAIEDAKVNSRLNGITNTSFFAGDIKDLLSESFLTEHGRPHVVITDPPRSGMHEGVTRMLLKTEAEKIVYVSCNPATQARDLKILSEKYQVIHIQPVDMFPQTNHVENVVLLKKV
ncbi:MAG: RNA methyltransferase, TrmA family [Cytophagales bacterium]|jgi:23S rRNA (uracil1939-C5)-methyltransferase|nr:23S rRNA (uracil(1939)-C(5))-methyltransferase RlmD [Bacteroidota bacterium]MBS1979652.1 23S rRNA (uracil(1939)-C(5))-methyltransferase RlmD [Bacteroidota bacterium]WHZ06905.1 MAG: RNA methyltransferase, TrmA family [Cytophagales bacterium]